MESSFCYGGSGVNPAYERLAHPESEEYGVKKIPFMRKGGKMGEKMIRKPKRPIIPISVVSAFMKDDISFYLKGDAEGVKISTKAKKIAHNWITDKLVDQIKQGITFMQSSKRVTLMPSDFLPSIRSLQDMKNFSAPGSAPAWYDGIFVKYSSLYDAAESYVATGINEPGRELIDFKAALDKIFAWSVSGLEMEGFERYVVTLVKKNQIKGGRVSPGVKYMLAAYAIVQLHELVIAGIINAIRSSHRVVLSGGDLTKAINARHLINIHDYSETIGQGKILGEYVPKDYEKSSKKSSSGEPAKKKRKHHHKRAKKTPTNWANFMDSDLDDEDDGEVEFSEDDMSEMAKRRTPSKKMSLRKRASPKPPTPQPFTPKSPASKSVSFAPGTVLTEAANDSAINSQAVAIALSKVNSKKTTSKGNTKKPSKPTSPIRKRLRSGRELGGSFF